VDFFLSFAWLELVSHRSFMPKMLTGNGQKGWPYIQRLLVDLFQFMEPFLRHAELGDPVCLSLSLSQSFNNQLCAINSVFMPNSSYSHFFFVMIRSVFSIKAHLGCSWCFFMTSQSSYVTITLPFVMLFLQVAFRCEISS